MGSLHSAAATVQLTHGLKREHCSRCDQHFVPLKVEKGGGGGIGHAYIIDA